MKHLIFAIALIFFATQANAETAGVVGTWSCGADCTATLDSEGNMKITGSGKMSNFNPRCGGTPRICTSDSPWLEYKSQIKSVDIQGVSNVGAGTFYSIGSIKQISLGDSITSIGYDAFSSSQISTIELPANLTYIGTQAFEKAPLETIIISDKIATMNYDSLGANPSTLKNANIICRGDNCDRVKELFKEYVIETRVNGEWIYTPTDISSSVVLAGEDNCDSSGYYWSGKFCHNRPTDGSMIECDEGWYATNKDVCARIKLRYTLPEADEATSNDNENMIEWIFE